MKWSSFLQFAIKHMMDLKPLINLAEEIIKAEFLDRGPLIGEFVKQVWPMLADLKSIAGFSVSADGSGEVEFSAAAVSAMEAELHAAGFDGSRLKKLWAILEPMLPVLIGLIGKAAG